MELDVARQDLFVHLNRNWKPYTAAVRQKPELDYIAYADGLGYLARLHAILYEMKAFLDLLARVMCRLISSTPGPNGFNKGKVADVELSGGRLVNWLAGHTIESLPTRDSLVSVITESSREWITEAVALRDTLGHYRDIAGFRHMRVSVSKGTEDLQPTDILAPEMHHGTPIDVFAYQLRDRVCAFASAVLQLLPGVKSELNESWPKAARYLNEK